MLKALFCSLITCLPVNHSHAGDFENYEELQALIVSLEKETIYPHGELAGIFAEVKRQNKALEAMMRPAESTKEWKDYRSQFLSNDRINKGSVLLLACLRISTLLTEFAGFSFLFGFRLLLYSCCAICTLIVGGIVI